MSSAGKRFLKKNAVLAPVLALLLAGAGAVNAQNAPVASPAAPFVAPGVPAASLPPAANGSPGAVSSLSSASPATQSASASDATVPAIPEGDPRRFLFEAKLPAFSRPAYEGAVGALMAAFEKKTGNALKPGKTGCIGLKIYTASGPGIATPKNLVRAIVKELEKRGFVRGKIYLVDLSEKTLRESGYLPPLRAAGVETFEGCPVLALDTERYYSARWFYENPLPSREIFTKQGDYNAALHFSDTKSFLPAALFKLMDCWLNLAVALDSPALGVSGALGNATIWNISNQRRFLDNPGNAQKVAIEIAAIPEIQRSLVFHILTLERYQYVGGPKFDANYCASERRLWLSANPLVLDLLMFGRINAAREKRDFPKIEPEPEMFVRGNTPPILLGSCRPAELELITTSSPSKR